MQLWGARSEKTKGHLQLLGSCWGGDPNLFSLHLTPRPLPLPLLPFHPQHLGKELSPSGTLELRLGLCLLCQPKAQPITLTPKGLCPIYHQQPIEATQPLQARLGEKKRASHVQSPACTPLLWSGQRARWLGDPPRESSSEVFAHSFRGSGTSLPHEPAQRTDSCTHLALPLPSPHTLPWLPGLRQNPRPCAPRPPAASPRELPPPIQFLPVPAHVFLLPGMFKPSLFIYRQALCS